VLGDGSMVAPERLPKMLAEMVRVATPGAIVAWWLPTASSFGEFFSIYWEALLRAGLEDHFSDVENLITERLTVSDVEALAEQNGLKDVTSWTTIEEFGYDSGEQFLNSPLIAGFLLRQWLRALTVAERELVTQEISQIVDEERGRLHTLGQSNAGGGYEGRCELSGGNLGHPDFGGRLF
jgi:hypothetical protein